MTTIQVQHNNIPDELRSRTVSHDRQDETPEAKARWFQSLSLVERMELLCLYTDLILSINPDIADRKHVKPAKGRVLVVSKT
jgi:hypothetical protein